MGDLNGTHLFAPARRNSDFVEGPEIPRRFEVRDLPPVLVQGRRELPILDNGRVGILEESLKEKPAGTV